MSVKAAKYPAGTMNIKYNISDFIYAGGVSSSKYIRTYLSDKLGCDFNLIFGNPALSSDNAVGTALLGGLKIWL